MMGCLTKVESGLYGANFESMDGTGFWYFLNPFGGLIELDADMDIHDDHWKPRHVPANELTSQAFLFKWTEKWSPRGEH